MHLPRALSLPLFASRSLCTSPTPFSRLLLLSELYRLIACRWLPLLNGESPSPLGLGDSCRCYFSCEDIDAGVKIFEEYISSRPPTAELYVEKMNARGFFLNPKMGSDLLLAAAGEKMGGYTTANYVWDLLQSHKITPWLPAVKAFYEGLKEREIPSDNPRLVLVGRSQDNVNLRFGGRRNV
ncbi:pentatricopeptide repeat-containing protein At4g35850, mitochondrial-like [Musa acuminata AAA Group]|uniref:pentatricopeptide repeat-containing protein At4g35850, mitochondrial-like n=1 Tax=Musa acuminata AAA Group TaxID=214697 RepID=UPI0031E3DC38